MARVETDRDDLLREAVALVRRMEFRAMPGNQLIVVGFRPTGWLSIYFDADPMYQFDELGRLRRAYIDGLLYRSEGCVLAQLERQRSPSETTLVRRDLSGESLVDFQQQAHAKIRWLQALLRNGDVTISRQVPSDDASLTTDVLEFLGVVLGSAEFLAPAIRR